MRSEITGVLERKKLQLFFLFYMIMALPLLTSLAENLSWIEVALAIGINLVLFLSLAALSVFCSTRTEKVIYSVLFIFSYLPNAIFTSYLLFAGVLLQKNSIISLFETNPDESREFMTHYFDPLIAAGCVAYSLLCFLIIWKMKTSRRLKIKKHKAVFACALIVSALIVSVPQLSRAVYFVNFYKMFVYYKVGLGKEECAIAERQNITYAVESVRDSIPKTIVVVVGESLTRNHMSLYGYRRDTNPKLSLLGDSLHVYQDVISPQVHTIPVIRSLLTLSDRDNPDYIVEKPSLFELFNRAGYETNFITNQPFGGNFRTSYDALLGLSQHKYNLSIEKLPDEIVLPTLRDIVSEKGDSDRIILIHLIGNHMAYELRYTPSFNVFNNKIDNKVAIEPYRDNQEIHTIDKYDNSVLYNDYVISAMIDILKEQYGRNSALIYFSDHGEELYDNRHFAGHAYEKVSSYMCEVPFVVWMSPGFQKHRPDLVIDTARPFSTSDFLFSVTDLAGIGFDDYASDRSLFSRNFTPRQRYIGDYTYQEILEKTKKSNP